MAQRQLAHDDYTVGWICPLEVEQTAATIMLDEQHPRLEQPIGDPNAYTLGSIQHYNIVIASLPSAGNNPAATVVAHMRRTFPNLRVGLLVGIGGGVPTQTDAGPIRLGHVVVSKPTGMHSGVVQYDHGKAEAGEFRPTGSLAPPPSVLLAAAQTMESVRARARLDPFQAHLRRIDTSLPGLRRYRYPGAHTDHLYRADYTHVHRDLSCEESGCDPKQRLNQHAKDDVDEKFLRYVRSPFHYMGNPVIVHRGTIASGGLVMRNGMQRGQLARRFSVLCFEMEAAGVLNDFPCLVIRGISDYADSHKNNMWHGFAAAAAAAYARELFFHMPIV